MHEGLGLGEYLLGCAFAIGTLAACAYAATAIVGRRLPWLTGSPRVLALAVAGTAAVLAAHLVPAMLGVLSRSSAAVAALAIAGAASRLRPTRATHAPAGPAGPVPAGSREGPLSWPLVGASAAASVAMIAVATRAQATGAVDHVDQLAVYLPDVARLIQRGSIWHNDQFVPLLANGNYPQNGVLLQLAAVLPWRQDAFVRFAPYPFAGLSVVALYALARETGAPRTTAWLAGVAFLSMPHVSYLIVQGLADAIVLFGLATGTLFLLRASRSGMRSELVLAGAALGLAFGTKWYAAPAALIVVAAWLLQRMVRERALRRPVSDAILVAGALAAAGGVWLVRNLAVTPSPIFPSAVRPFGVELFAAPANELTQRNGFSIGDYLGDRGVLVDAVLPAWWDAWGPFVPFVLAGAAAALLAGRRDSRVVLLAAVAGACLAAYVLTPNGAWGPEGAPQLVGPNARYALPAMVAAAALTASLGARSAGTRVAVELALALAVAIALAKSLFVVDVVTVAAVAVVALAAALALARAPRPTRAQALAVVAALAVTGVIGGRLLQERHAEGRYANHDAAAAYVLTTAPEGHRVGIAGLEVETSTSPVYPAFGPRLRNHVEYVGRFVDGLLRRHEDRRAFASALARGGFDLLIVYRPADPAATAREEAWARGAGFERLAQDGRITLLGRAR